MRLGAAAASHRVDSALICRLKAGSVHSEDIDRLRRDLQRYPRQHGYYLLSFVPLPPDWRDDEEAALTAAFEALDSHPWAPPELRPSGQPWADYEACEATARAYVVAVLVGGREIGHSRDTIPEEAAHALWARFRALFLLDTRFFLGVGLGDPAYVFQQGSSRSMMTKPVAFVWPKTTSFLKRPG